MLRRGDRRTQVPEVDAARVARQGAPSRATARSQPHLAAERVTSRE